MSSTINYGAVLHGPKDLRVEKIPCSPPGKNEVLLSMGSVGICGSDIKYWLYGQCGKHLVLSPMVMGHEAAGTVVQLGEDVKHLKVGDRVAIEPGVPCRQCRLCKSGRYNLCREVFFCATPPDDGNLCQFYKHAADFCYKLPDHMSLEEGAMMEPLAVAVYSCQRGEVAPGSNVLVLGAGPVGILTMMVAKQMGANCTLITGLQLSEAMYEAKNHATKFTKSGWLHDIDEHRLKVAKSMGADHVIKVTTTDPKELANQIEATMGNQPDVSIECSAVDFSFSTALHATHPGGAVVMVGRGSMDVTIPYTIAATKEVDIKGIFRYANCYPVALDLIASGALDVRPLITHRFKLNDTLKAFETAIDRGSKAMKVIINCHE